MPDIIPKSSYDYRFRREGKRILILRDGVLVCDWPFEFAKEQVIPLLKQLVLRCEEEAEAPRIAMDSAILLRAGARMVLSGVGKIVDEAKKLAAHDRSLRSYMPSIKSQERFGVPTFEIQPPKAAEGKKP